MKLAERIETVHLVLRKPVASDAEAVFFGWASDAAATRFMTWKRHTTLSDTTAFLECSDEQWDTWPAGPYVIESRETDDLIGSCGIAFTEPHAAAVGYILAPDFWGRGHATECVLAMIEAVRVLGQVKLEAHTHPMNLASMRVLEKCGFTMDDPAYELVAFPNPDPPGPVSALRYALALDG